MKRSIFEYRNGSRYLLDRVTEMQKADKDFSIRKWAKQMGFPSHSLLSMILQGKRNLTLRQVPFFTRGLDLSTPEKLFFEGLIQIENAKTPEERQWCEIWLSELRPATASKPIREIDEYEVISNWIHPAILALSDTRRSFRRAEEAANHLGISAHEARAALARLEAVELIKKNASGIYRATSRRTTTKDDIVSLGAREHHRQSANLAAERVAQQDLLEREFQSIALAIPSNRIPLAKELIRKFRTQFALAMASEHSDLVYQLNLHFFRLTERPSEQSAQTENEGADTHQLQQKGSYESVSSF